MRNAGLTTLLAAALAAAGCQTNQQKPDDLEAGRTALMQHNYDAAQESFDAWLAKNPGSPRVAEVNYLKGRALEDAPADDLNQAKAHLQQARVAYIDALKAGTDSRGLEGLIRASLADVAYWQEDYTTAASQGVSAYPLLDDNTTRAWSLYRAAVSLQRIGRFEDADKRLAAVVQYHPGTEPAARAKPRIGLRAFNVRIPADTNAVATATVLGKQGYPAAVSADGKSVLVGPYVTFAQSSAARGKLESQFPKAEMLP